MGWRATRRRAKAQAKSAASYERTMAEVGDQPNGHFLEYQVASPRSFCCETADGIHCGHAATFVRVERYWAYTLGVGPVPGTKSTPVCDDHAVTPQPSPTRREGGTFVIYTDNETWAGGVHPFQALLRYRDIMGISARLIVVGMTSTGFRGRSDRQSRILVPRSQKG